MRHPAARCLTHPTGRMLSHRPENALDLDEVFEVALETGVALEVNGLPDRLDLSRCARGRGDRGGRLDRLLDRRALGGRLELIELSVATARRGASRAAAW